MKSAFLVGVLLAVGGGQAFTQLSSADVGLYLEVLQAAAARIKDPTAADRAQAEEAEEATERQRRAYDKFAAKHPAGVKPTAAEIAELKASNPSPAESLAIAHTRSLRLTPEMVVAADRHLDLKRFREIRAIINRLLLLSPATATREVDRQNLLVLKPHEAEIREAIEAITQGRGPERD